MDPLYRCRHCREKRCKGQMLCNGRFFSTKNNCQSPWVKEIFEYTDPELHMELAPGIVKLGRPDIAPFSCTFEGDGELIGIADTGIDATHPDLTKNLHAMKDWGGLGVILTITDMGAT